MNLQQLRYFVAVASTGGFSAAASQANASQPALSRQIKLLEQELGAVLFERRSRGVQLTEAGLRLQNRVPRLLADVNELRTYVAEAATAPSGEVVLAASSSLRVLLTGPVVEEYCARYPGVSLTIAEGMSRAMREAVAEGRADIGVFADAEPLDPLECTPLLTERLCVLGPADAGLRMSAPVDAAVLAKHPLVLTAAPNSLRTLVDRALRSAGYEYKSRLQVEMSSLILDLVQRGVGWSILPYCGVHHMLQAGLISAAPLRGVTFSWVVATSRERRVTQAARLLANVIVAVARRAVLARGWRTARWDHDRMGSPRSRYRPPDATRDPVDDGTNARAARRGRPP